MSRNLPLQTCVRSRTIQERMGGVPKSAFEEILQCLGQVRCVLHVHVLNTFQTL